jgi:hypothetical protein
LAWNFAIIAAVDTLLYYAQANLANIIALIRRMVECESPSDAPQALANFVSLISAEHADGEIHTSARP